MAIGFLDGPTRGPLANLQEDLQNAVGNVLGNAAANTINSTFLPWESSSVESKFFRFIKIDGSRWDQLFPYRLIVIDSSNSNQVVNGSEPADLKTTVTRGTGSAIIEFQDFGARWVFELPISPEQLNISDQYSINTSATLRGILEEHNGVRFKMINCSGTMGVWPGRASVTKPPQSPTFLQSVFGGVLESVGNLANQFNRVINAATSGHPASKPITLRPEDTSDQFRTTGYYQSLKLQQFLEQYAEAKKDPKNASWRLVFDMPKQNQAFIVTPLQFNWAQNASKPMLVNYSFHLKAWRRIDLNSSPFVVEPNVESISPGILQRVLSTITEARKLMSASLDLIGAVRSDVEKPLDVLRQTSLFAKDLAGVAVTAADLPFQLQRDYKSGIGDFLNTLNLSSSDSVANQALTALKGSYAQKEGISISAVESGQLGNTASQAQAIDPANNIFKSPERNFTLMDQVPLFNINLNAAQQDAVDKVINDARQTTVDDLKGFRSTIQELSLQLSNNFGAGDAYYSRIYGRPPPVSRISPMTIDEYEILKSLYDVMQAYDILTATTQIDDLNKQSNMEYVAGLADQAGIPFSIPGSKILAPVPFGLTVEAIASRYLGDAQRWLEIVTLNNLRDPYIDENGFKLNLLSNATGRQITISSITDLYIGQRVVLHSSTQSPSARKILGIDRLSDTSFLITLDGLPDLDNFVIADQAYLQAYLPGTVNSQQKIFIPSDLPIPNDPNIKVPASVAGDQLVGLSKVDWLLTDKGDIALNSFGDFRFSAGMTNLIQAIKIKFGTIKGTWLTHPEFGLGVRPGTINSEIKAQDLYNEINALVKQDPRFLGLSKLQVSLNGPVLSINLAIILAGQNGVFPITFEIAA